MSKSPIVAIIGATGAVGIEMIRCLEQRNFPLSKLILLASSRSAGKIISFRGQNIVVEPLTESSFVGVDIALFAAGGSISKQFASHAVSAGAVVIDNSSAFRMRADVPLIVPEINPEQAHNHQGIIANPNCSTIISLLPLWSIHQHNPIKRVIAATYQAASGAGAIAMEELEQATKAHLEGEPFQQTILPHPYAFNLFSHNSSIDLGTGYNEEELKMLNETRKIFANDTINISTTCVRVPILRAHSIALHVECHNQINPADVHQWLKTAPGIVIIDEPERNYFPMPLEASGRDEVLVGRIRQDMSDPTHHSIALFVVGDQLLKGAALNAIQIAELLID
jgi:aspartate-semialdehyde dehydrogenase